VCSSDLRTIERLPIAARGLCLIAICLVASLWYGSTAARLGVFGPVRAEDRYKIVGEYVARALPANAAVLTVIQSGSIRWYGKRTTLRWDLIEEGRLDAAINVLQAEEYEPYILLEDDEEPMFRSRFQSANVFGRIDWPPLVVYTGLPHVRIYAAADRARHLGGEWIATQVVPAAESR